MGAPRVCTWIALVPRFGRSRRAPAFFPASSTRFTTPADSTPWRARSSATGCGGSPWLTRQFLGIYNSLGILSNNGDTIEDLEAELASRFGKVNVKLQGSVALLMGSTFSALHTLSTSRIRPGATTETGRAVAMSELRSRSFCRCDFLPPSPPAEKTTARRNQAGQASTGNGAWNATYEAKIIFGLQHLARRRKMLIVRPKARLFCVSSSEVCVIGT